MHFIILGFFYCFQNLCSWIQPHLGKVFPIWMIFYVALGNCAISKSKACNVLSNLNGGIIGFNVFTMFLAGVNERRHPSHFLVKRT